MSLFQGDYLRVLTPETIDGVTIKMVNDRMSFKESHMPLSALKDLQRENDRLPTHLKHRIERVTTNFGPASTPQPTQTAGKIKQK